jgi:Protein of unknown function (DUF3352)
MSRQMRVRLAVLLAGLVLGATGCGGSDTAATGGAGAAAIAPENAALYATINTDLDSEEVDQLEELLAKFPDRERLLAEIQKGLAEEDLSWETDIKPALGETLDVVLLGLSDEDVVAILKPADEAKLKALLDKGGEPNASRKIDGWTVIADDEAVLDRFENARSSGALEDNAEFNEAMDGLPEEALVKLYVNGDAATEAAGRAGASSSSANRVESFAAALGAESSGIRVEGVLASELEDDLASKEPYEATLLDAAPEGALAFVSGNGYDAVEKSLRDVPGTFNQLREFLGVDIEGVTELFEGEFAFWIGQGAPIPEVTFLAEVDDEQRAIAALDRLAGVVPGGQQRTTEVDGVQAKQVVVEGFPITYASFDGKVIATTRPGAIADVREDGESLADDPDFEQAKEDAGMPGETFGFVYLNVERLAALVEGFAGVSGEEIPPEVARNLEPLGSFVLSSSGEPEDLEVSAFLSIE